MNPSNPPTGPVPPAVAAKLRALRRRRLALGLLEGILLAGAVLLGAILAAMLLDYAAGWFDPRARYVVTGLALAAGLGAVIRWCLRPLAHRPTLVGAARQVDDALPQLEERWSTVTELSQNTDAPAVRGSDALIRQVGSEAASAGDAIDPRRVIPAAAVLRAGRWFLASAGATALLFALNFPQARVLWQRFWLPGANLSLTRVTASPSDGWVPKGEPLSLRATVAGRRPGQAPTLFLRPAQGASRTAPMTAQSTTNGTYQYGLDEVTDSFEYRVRAGDGQTPWHRITAADRPRIAEVRLQVTPPAYSGLPAEQSAALPGSVRVLDGSDLEIAFRSDQPLERLVLDLGEGRSIPLEAEGDNWYRFRDRPTNSFTLTAAAWNRYRLENKVKPTCRISVYDDLPPSVRLLEPSDDVAVAPGEKVEVVFEAADDFGLAKAELLVTTTTAAGQTNALVLPVDLGKNAGRKQVRQSVPLDPAALGLKQGDQLSYVVRVTDTRQAPAQAGSGSGSPREVAAAAPPGSEPNPAEPPADPADPSDPKNDPTTAAASESKQGSEAPSPSAARTAAAKPSSPRPASGDAPPPNDMERRTLDAGQCTACTPRNIKVDEWAGSFDGEKRKKLEIAIEPVLREVDEQLARAEERTTGLRTRAGTAAGIVAGDSAALEAGKGHIASATQAIDGLRSRTTDTPYAFIGLQLHNIGTAHVSPARENLGRVAPGAGSKDNLESLDRTAFHLARARSMLADLTKTYESVKRDQQVADAMQRLSKMYQIFLEDTQPLLGSSKGRINSYDRKVAEVDDAFVEKLKALLEEKKKIMAELAKILAQDPRLLRRYLAMLQLEGTSYRDQMTLLAERQKELEGQLREWNATAEAGRPEFVEKLRQHYARLHRSVAEDATRLRENLETWLPLDVPPDQPQVKEMLGRAERILALTAQSAGTAGGPAGSQALEELRTLRDALPDLGRLEVTNRARLDAYVDNRVAEVEALVTAQAGRLKILEALGGGDFPQVAEVVQHRLNQETAILDEKLQATEGQMSSMSPEIAEKAAALLRIVDDEVLKPQGVSAGQLTKREVVPAQGTLAGVVTGFARAETAFDELMRLIVDKLDEAPAPGSPGGSPPSLESLLAMLQDEMKAEEGLGISCRPINVSLQRDWMRPGSNPGTGMGQGKGMGRGQAQAARGQAQSERDQARAAERRARESARQALAKAGAEAPAGDARAAAGTPRSEAWNKLASRLDKDLLQGRDNTPPEQYREAIASYFETLSEASSGARPSP
jgi:hypothetical protein